MSSPRTLSDRSAPESASQLTSVPDIDRARVFAENVASSVNAGSWVLARYNASGTPAEIVVPDHVSDGQKLAAWLKGERALQDRRGGPVPRVTRTLSQIAPYRSGLTIVYGDERGLAGMLMVLRTEEQLRFSELDETFLQSTLESGSAVLHRLRVFDGEQTARERAGHRVVPAQFVLREDLSIEYSWLPPQSDSDEVVRSMLSIIEDDRLPSVIENAVRSIVTGWGDDAAKPANEEFGVAIPLPFLLVRAVRLAGSGGMRIGVQIERFRARNAMNWASRRFHMSPRELQILALILQGLGTQEIADALHIAGSTANDHIKRMLLKTKSHNRVEMVAKVLGWRAAG